MQKVHDLGIVHEGCAALQSAGDEENIKILGALGEGRGRLDGNAGGGDHRVQGFPHEVDVDVAEERKDRVRAEQVQGNKRRMDEHGDLRRRAVRDGFVDVRCVGGVWLTCGKHLVREERSGQDCAQGFVEFTSVHVRTPFTYPLVIVKYEASFVQELWNGYPPSLNCRG
jgi:hypothetical protein